MMMAMQDTRLVVTARFETGMRVPLVLLFPLLRLLPFLLLHPHPNIVFVPFDRL